MHVFVSLQKLTPIDMGCLQKLQYHSCLTIALQFLLLSHSSLTMGLQFLLLSHSCSTMGLQFLLLSHSYVTMALQFLLLSHSCVTMALQFLLLSNSVLTMALISSVYNICNYKKLYQLKFFLQFFMLCAKRPHSILPNNNLKLGLVSSGLVTIWQHKCKLQLVGSKLYLVAASCS